MDTVYSLSGEVPPLDSWVGEGEGSALQPGLVVVGSVRQICSLRKLGAGGAVLHADVPVEEGRRLELELEGGQLLEGRVVWRRGSELGLRFDEPVDVLPIVARNLANQPGERRRMPRIEVTCPARIETGTRSALAAIRDIAQGGAKVEAPFALTVEEKILLVPEGFRPVEGRVRWVSEGLSGIAFDSELCWQELMPWLRTRCRPDTLGFAPPPPPPIAGAAAPPPEPEPSGSVQLNLPARVREGTRRWTIDVSSLDTRGVAFECYAALRLGTLLWIVLPGLEGWPARIVAIEGYRFTCEFTQPLHPAVLERVLASARGEARLA